MTTASTQEFVVVCRTNSSVVVRQQDPHLVLNNLNTAGRRVRVEFFTKYDEEEFGVPIPHELYIEVRGPAESLDEALTKFWQIANSLIGPLAVSSNAPIGDPHHYVAFDNTPGRSEREFVQHVSLDERGLPHDGRYLRVRETSEFISAIVRHPQGERLQRAIEHYRFALNHWQPGREVLTVEHLFVAAEALKVIALQGALQHSTTEQLADLWNVKRGADRRIRIGDLQSAARREIVFNGDKDCHDKAAKASDGLEHGYEAFREITSLALQVKDQTFTYIRNAIINLSGISSEVKAVLLAPPLGIPQSDLETFNLVRAKIVGATEHIRGDQSPYPYFKVNERSFKWAEGEDGTIKFTGSDTLTASIGSGLSFQIHSFETWGQLHQQ